MQPVLLILNRLLVHSLLAPSSLVSAEAMPEVSAFEVKFITLITIASTTGILLCQPESYANSVSLHFRSSAELMLEEEIKNVLQKMRRLHFFYFLLLKKEIWSRNCSHTAKKKEVIWSRVTKLKLKRIFLTVMPLHTIKGCLKEKMKMHSSQTLIRLGSFSSSYYKRDSQQLQKEQHESFRGNSTVRFTKLNQKEWSISINGVRCFSLRGGGFTQAFSNYNF